jgi:hypothetical protein
MRPLPRLPSTQFGQPPGGNKRRTARSTPRFPGAHAVQELKIEWQMHAVEPAL